MSATVQTKQLRAAFAGRLRERAAALVRGLAALAASPTNGEALKAVHLVLHNLKGSAASFGFTEIARLSAPAEAFARAMSERGAAPTAEGVRALSVLVDALLPSMSTAASDAGSAAGHVELAVESVEPEPQQADVPLVLMIERDRDISTLIEVQLRKRGFEVEALPSMGNIPEAVRRRVPSAILVGHVPEGADVAPALSVLQAGSPIPVVFTAVGNDLGARLRILRAGGRAFFAPATDFDALARHLDVLCAAGQSQLRAMIVEDDRDQGRYHSQVLGQAGIHTRCVLDPRMVLDQLIAFEPDVLVLDIQMDSCTGIELAALLRRDHRTQTIPIVFLTAERDEQTRRSAFGVGADDFITKPVVAEDFVDRVRRRGQRGRLLREQPGRLNSGGPDERGLDEVRGVGVLKVAARVEGDVLTSRDCRAILSGVGLLSDRGQRRVVLDWSDVDARVSPETLVDLLRGAESYTGRDVKLAFCSVPRDIARPMRIVGLDRIPTLANRGDAVSTLLEQGASTRPRLSATRELRIDLERARRFQERMLPNAPPTLAGYEIAVSYQPCGELSGDFYDFYELEGGRLGIAIGDATGHGVSAALVTGICKKLLKLAAAKTSSPREALQIVNGQLYGETDGATFVTVLYGVLDPADHSFRFVRAGHEPLLVHEPRGDIVVSSMMPGGLPLGLVRDDRFASQLEESVVGFNPGMNCLMYSDGLTELHSEQGEQLEFTGLSQVMRGAGAIRSAKLITLLEKTVAQHRGRQPLEDDMTILALSRR